MITIVSGTNRKNSQTHKIATFYAALLKEQNIECQILDLSVLPQDFVFSALYGEQNDGFNELTEKYILNVSKIVIVSPEYNGSYPGILKAFIDGWNPKKTPGKWVSLVGVASGRQGNARGMDDLTNVLNYLQINVVPVKPPISQIFNVIDEKGTVHDLKTIELLKQQIQLLTEK